jgi:hypothetical protein
MQVWHGEGFEIFCCSRLDCPEFDIHVDCDELIEDLGVESKVMKSSDLIHCMIRLNNLFLR